MKKILLVCAITGLFSADAFALDTFLSTDTGAQTRSKLNSNFTSLNTGKEPAVYVGETAPADTTKLFLDSNEEAGVLVQKKYVTGTGWVRVGSYGVQYASSCAGITSGMCVAADGKLYYHNGSAIVEVGSGGSYTLPTASGTILGGVKIGSRLTITDGVLSADVQSGTFDPTADIDFTGDVDFTGATVTGILPAGTENQIPVYNSSGALTATIPLTPVAGQGITMPVVGDTVTINAWGDDTAYGSSWNGSTKPVSQNAIYDKIESMGSGGATVPAAGIVTSNGTTLSSITPGTGVASALGNAVDGTGGLASKAALDAISSGSVPFISSGEPASANTINYNTTTHKLTAREPNGDLYDVAFTLKTAADTTPTAFTFTDVTGATLSTQYTGFAQITGINWPITCTASGGTTAACTGNTIDTCGTFGATSGSITNNQYVAAQITSSGSNSTPVNEAINCSGVSDTYSVTTAGGVSNVTYDVNVYTGEYAGTEAATDARLWGQSWTVPTGGGGTLTDVRLRAEAASGATITCRVGTSNGQLDMTSSYQTGTGTVSAIGEVVISFTSGPTLSVGSQYAVACRSSSSSESYFTLAGDAATSYSGGTGYVTTAADWDLTGHQDPLDLWFRYTVAQ